MAQRSQVLNIHLILQMHPQPAHLPSTTTTTKTDQYVKLKSGDVIRFGTETTLTLDMASDAPPAAVPAPAPPTTTAPDTTTMTTTTGKPTTATVTETEPEMDMATDALTVQQFLEAECVRLEQHIRVRRLPILYGTCTNTSLILHFFLPFAQ